MQVLSANACQEMLELNPCAEMLTKMDLLKIYS